MSIDFIDRKVIQDAFNKFGEDAQLMVMVEEAAELIKAIVKYMNRGGPEIDIREELADVIIMANQLVYFLGKSEVENVIEQKLSRLEKKLEKYQDYNDSSIKVNK